MKRIAMVSMLAATVLAGGASAQTIRIDGAHALYPMMTDAVRERAGLVADLEFSSTEEGIDRLCGGEVDIVMADRPILAEEAGFCAETGIEPIELPVGLDAVVFVANPANDWAEGLGIEDIERIWAPASEGEVRLWSDVRPDWPDTVLSLYGPDPDAPAAEQLAQAFVGEQLGLRTDYAAMDDFDLLAQSVSREAEALAFMSFGGLMTREDGLVVLPVDIGEGPVAPEVASILDGSYPFARVHLLYVAASSAALPEVQGFVADMLAAMPQLAVRSGFVPLPEEAYAALAQRLEAGETELLFGSDGAGLPLEMLNP
jgi:phosphate transport system substrate-binding protein